MHAQRNGPKEYALAALTFALLFGFIAVVCWSMFSPQAQACGSARADYGRALHGAAPDAVHVVTTVDGSVVTDTYRYPLPTMTDAEAARLEQDAQARFQQAECTGTLRPSY